MGFFSFKCNCCDKSISNSFSIYGATPVMLLTPFGSFKEENYEGYGVFGGIDVYAMAAVILGKATFDVKTKKFFINGVETDQDKVRDLSFENFDQAGNTIKVTCLNCYNENINYENSFVSDNCPNQGYFYEDEDDYNY